MKWPRLSIAASLLTLWLLGTILTVLGNPLFPANGLNQTTGWIALLPAMLIGLELLLPSARLRAACGVAFLLFVGVLLSWGSPFDAVALDATLVTLLLASAGMVIQALTTGSGRDLVRRAVAIALLLLFLLSLGVVSADPHAEIGTHLHPLTRLALLCGGIYWLCHPFEPNDVHRVTQASAAWVLGIAVLVLCGWITGGALITRALPEAPPMHALTAIAMMLTAAALHVFAEGRRRDALWCMLPVTLLALALTLPEVLGFSTSLQGWLQARTPIDFGKVPPWMAPNTAAALLLAALSILSAPGDSAAGPLRWAVTWALAFLVGGIAAVALGGYLFDAPPLKAWGPYPPMTLPAALCLAGCALGLGFAGGHSQLTTKHRTLIVPLLVAIASLMATSATWVAMKHEQAQQEQQVAHMRLAALLRTMELGTQLRQSAMTRLTARISELPSAEQPDRFERQARQLLADFPAILRMALIDGDGRIRVVQAQAGAQPECIAKAFSAAVGNLPADSRRRPAAYSAPMCGDRLGHLLRFPITSADGVSGMIEVFSDVGILLNAMLKGIPDDIGLRIYAGTLLVDEAGFHTGSPAATATFPAPGLDLRVDFWWQASRRPAQLAKALSFVGLLTGALLALALRLAALARERALAAELSGQQLRMQMVEAQRLQSALSAAERELGDVITSISDALIAVDRDWRILLVNPPAERMIGRSSADLLGKVLWDEFRVAAASSLRQHFQRALESGTVLRLEHWSEALAIWVETRAFPHSQGLAIYFQDISERKRAELALRKAQASSERAQKMALLGSWEVDLGSGARWWSEQALQLFDITEAEVAEGLPAIARHIHPDDRQLVIDAAARLQAGEADVDMEYRVLRADGTLIHVHELGTVFRDGEGRPVLAAGSLQDVSEHRRIEDQLRDLTKQLELSLSLNRLVMQHSLDVICVIDGAGRFALISDGCARLWGHAPNELLGTALIDLVFPEDRARTETMMAAVAAGQPTLDFRNRLLSRDGKTLYLQWSAVWSEREELMFCIGRDISESRMVASALRRSESLLRNAQRIAKVGHWQNNLVTGELVGSPEAHRIFGTSSTAEAPTFERFLNHVHPGDRSMVAAAQQRLLSGGHALDVEHRIVHADGSVLWVHQRGEIETDSSGAAIAVSGTVLDITERKRAELHLARSNRLHSVLSRINKTIARLHDVDELYRAATSIAVEQGGFIVARIFAVQEDNTARSVAAAGAHFAHLGLIEIPLDDPVQAQGTIGTALRTGLPSYTNNIEADPRMQPWREAASQSGIRATASFPLMVNDKAVAALVLFAEEVDYFQDDELSMLSSVATDLSFALTSIDAEQRQQQAERRNIRLTRLYAVSSSVNAMIVRTPSPAQLYAGACRIAVEQGGLLMAWVGLLDPHSDELVPAEYAGASDGYLESITILGRKDSIQGAGPGGEAFRTGKPAVCNNIDQAAATFAWREKALQRGFHSCAAFPLSQQNEVIGILVVYADSTDYFDAEELALLGGLCDNLSFALDLHAREELRRRAERALRESEATLANAQRLARLGSWEWQIGPDRLYWSDEVFRIVGMDRTQFGGNSAAFLERIHPEDRAEVERVFREAVATGSSFQHEYRVICPDGSEIVLLEMGEPLRNAKGRVDRIAGSVLDITERKRAELAVRENEEKFRSVFDQSPIIICLLTYPEGIVVEMNTAGLKAFGYTREQLLGRSSTTTSAWVDAEERQQYLDMLSSQGSVRDFEALMRRADGRQIPVLYNGNLVRLGGKQYSLNSLQDISQRKQAEAALRASEQLFSNAFEYAAVGVALLSPDGYWLRVNQALCEMLGYQREELLGSHFADITHPEDLRQDMTAVEGLISGALVTYQQEKRYFHKSGRLVWVLLNVSLLRDAEGRPLNFVAQIQDTTQRKLTERRLQEQHALLEGIAARQPLNQSLTRLMHLAEQMVPDAMCSIHILEESGQFLERGIAPSLPDRFCDAIAGERIGEGSGSCGTAAYRGERVIVTDIASDPLWKDYAGLATEHGLAACWSVPVRSSVGTVLATFAIYYREPRAPRPGDLESVDALIPIAAVAIEQALAYRQLKTSEQRFRSLFDEHPDAVYALDLDGRVTDYNGGFEAWTGVHHDQVVGQPLESSLFAGQRELVRAQFDAVAAGQARTYDSVATGPDGRRHDARVTNLPIIVEGKVTGVFGIAHDITPLRERERELAAALELTEQKSEQLREALDALNMRNRELQDFAFVASHDLQEPLRKIRTFSDRLLQGHAEQLDQRARDYLDRSLQAAQRMQTLIDDLLAYSRIASRSNPATPVDLNEILAGVIDDLEARIESTRGKVEVPPLPTLLADPTHMRQLFQNLIGNALKFHKPDTPPLVQLSVEPAQLADGTKAWKFCISDHGIGFEQQYANRIFSPFQRLHGREQYAGTGIGLAIVRRIVERHGGTIEATSAPGQGARFTLILPDRAVPPATREPETPVLS